MRKLMCFAIGFAVACVAGAYLFYGSWLLIGALIAGTIMLPCLVFKVRSVRIIGTILLGCAVGFGWFWCFDHYYLTPARQLDTQSLQVSMQISDYGYATDYGVAADGELMIAEKPYKVRIYLNGDQELSPGDKVDGLFRFRFTADGGEDEATHHPGKGIFQLAYEKESVTITQAETVPVKYFPATLRRNIQSILSNLFPEDTVGFARALLLGDTSLLSFETDTAFKVSGVRHVIAVSGLHVSILFSLVYTVSGRRKWLTALVGLPVLLLFAAVAGFTPSVVRACLMQALILMAMLFDREYDPPTALAFAALVMLVCNPMTITSVSFQLSVGCMIGIFLFSEKISKFLLDPRRLGPAKGNSLKAKLSRWVVGSVSVTLSAMVVTTPLCAWYFGVVSLVGILTNLLVLWVVSYIFYGIMAACLLSFAWLPAAKGVAWAVSWLIRYVTGVSKLLASVPFAAMYTCSVYTVLWLIGAYTLLGIYFLCKKKHTKVFAGSVLCLLLACLLFSWLEPKLDDYRVTVLDVGQGQSILLQSDGKTYLVDCGGDSAKNAAEAALQQLSSQWINKLDGVILTHYDADHVGGIEYLLSVIDTETIYLPQAEDDSGIKEQLQNLYAEKVVWVSSGEIVAPENGLLTLVGAQLGKSGNESSTCILFQPKNCDILITGDRDSAAERALLQQISLPKLELLVAGHHGSNNATCFELLSVTQPKHVVFSVGRNNKHGHPAEAVLTRLARFNCRIWRTDLHKTIIFRG